MPCWPLGPGLTSHHARVKSGRRQRCDPYPNRARGSSCLAATRTTLRSRCYVRTLRSPTFHFEFANVSCALFLIQQILALPSRHRTLRRTSSGLPFRNVGGRQGPVLITVCTNFCILRPSNSLAWLRCAARSSTRATVACSACGWLCSHSSPRKASCAPKLPPPSRVARARTSSSWWTPRSRG